MALSGGLIAESLKVGAVLEAVPLTVRRIYRADAGDVSVGQPLTWTFVDFEAPVESAEALAVALSETLDEALGWYCDFRSPDETFVVFAGRVFRYPRGNRTARAEVEEYGRSVGVPESQLDWPE
ncbi:MAG: hypothetical protein ACT4PI_17870 [Actinomycetota bacterium]